MEHSLHKQLKMLYCESGATQEVKLGDYRIDVVDSSGLLIEIQHSSLSAINRKCQHLLDEHRLLVVKPIIRTKEIIKLAERDGEEISRRKSPKRGSWLTAFEELVYFKQVFPHPNLEMDLVLVDIREKRFPGHGRRYRWRKNDHQVQDLELVDVVETIKLRRSTDLYQLLPFESIPIKFDTNDLANAVDIDRADAQRIAYCLREMGAVRSLGKRGRSCYYQRPVRKRVACGKKTRKAKRA